MSVLPLNREPEQHQPRSKSIAGRLRALLAEKQIPAVQVADALQLTQSKFARRMTGSVPFSVDELDAVCLTLGIRFEWLTTGFGPVFDDPDGGDGASSRDRTEDLSLTRSGSGQVICIYPQPTSIERVAA